MGLITQIGRSGGGSAGGVTAHAALTGLLAEDHPQYLLTATTIYFSGVGNTGHTHLYSAIESTGHSHDYSVIENTGHTHIEANITDLGDYAVRSLFESHTGDTGLHFTEASIDFLNISNTAHTHYYSATTDTGHTHLFSTIESTGHSHSQLDIPDRIPQTTAGFIDVADSTLSFDDTTRTFTIASGAVPYVYSVAGIKYSGATTACTVPSAYGMTHIYFGPDSTIYTSTSFLISSIRPYYAYIGNVFLTTCGTTRALGWSDERHSVDMPWSIHEYIHETIGAKWHDGLALDNFVTNGPEFRIVTGSFHDEDKEIIIPEIAAGSPLTIFYKTGATAQWLSYSAAGWSYPVMTAAGATNRAVYNNFAGGEWNHTEVTNGNYVLAHVYATNSKMQGTSALTIMGQAQYATLSLAQAGAKTEIGNIAFGALPSQEMIPLGTIIVRTSTSPAYALPTKSQLILTDTGANYVDWRVQKLVPGAGITDHGSLGGLSDNDHPQYALSGIPATIQICFDGQEAVVEAGKQLDVFAYKNMSITGWECLADGSGTVGIGVWKDIKANFPPTAADSIFTASTISAAISGASLASPMAVSIGDCIRFNINATPTPATITRITVALTGVTT
jgi:hypothetical protein